MARYESAEIEIADKAIDCAACETRIETTLSRLGGVAEVDADHKSQLVRLRLDLTVVTPEEIKERLDDLGYRVVH